MGAPQSNTLRGPEGGNPYSPTLRLLQLRWCLWISAYAEMTRTGLLRARQPQPHQQPAQILALAQHHRPAIDLRHVAHDREAEPGAGLLRIQPRAAFENRTALRLGNAAAVILDLHFDEARPALDRHEY